MGDPNRTRSLLDGAGFEVKRMGEVPVTWRFEDFDGYWRFLNELAGALSARIAALEDDERKAFREKLEEAVEPYRTEPAPGVAPRCHQHVDTDESPDAHLSSRTPSGIRRYLMACR